MQTSVLTPSTALVGFWQVLRIHKRNNDFSLSMVSSYSTRMASYLFELFGTAQKFTLKDSSVAY